MPRSQRQPLARLHRTLGIPRAYALERGLRRQREARRLVSIGRSPAGRPVRLTPRAAAAWRRMHAEAARAGVELWPISGFRSVSRQVRIMRRKLAAIPKPRREAALREILRVVAAPGYSEHHTGRAIDIGSAENARLDEQFADTKAFRWLRQHAGRFGFRLSFPRGNPHGIAYEPWHWCWHVKKSVRPHSGV